MFMRLRSVVRRALLARMLTPAGLVLFLLSAPVCRSPVNGPPLEITFIAVGDGNATLIRTPDHRTCLIDGGPTYAGANIIYPLLDSLGIRELDYTIATNYTPGRIGGLDEVIRCLGGEEGVLFDCLDRGRGVPSPEFRQYRQVAASRRHTMRPGDAVKLGAVTILCVAGNGRALGSDRSRQTIEEDHSLALLLSWHDFELLITSGLTEGPDEESRPMLAASIAEAYGPVEIASLGRRTPPRVIRDLNPQAVVISGADSFAGETGLQVLQRLSRNRRQVYRMRRPGPGSPADTWLAELLPQHRVRSVVGNVRVTVERDRYIVAGDTFEITNRRRPRGRR